MSTGRTHRNRSLVYKRAYFVGADGAVSDLLDSAMSERHSARLRQQPIDEDGGSNRFLNSWKRNGVFRYGTLFEYTRGLLPAGFKFDDALDELPIATLAELDEDTHMLESALHFGVLENHVVLMPTTAIRSGDFQSYLNWLLHETGVLPEAANIVLMDELTAELRARDWRRVKGIVLKSVLSPDVLRETELNPKSDARGILSGAVRDLVKNPEMLFGTLSASEALAMERLGVSLTLKYDGRTENLDTKLLDHVAALLRDDLDADYQLEVEGLGTLRANDVRVSQKRSIAHENGRPILENVAEKMQLWLKDLIDSQRVRP